MNKLLFFTAITLFAFGCNAQGNNQSKNNADSKVGVEAQTPGKKKPDVRWNVTKQYDENGNLIGYDSTYTYSYTNVEGDSVTLDADSVMRSFHSYFDQNFPGIWNKQFDNGFPNDSMFYRDFLQHDFFSQQWNRDFLDMDKITQEMDSLRMEFFKNQYPGMLEPEDNKQPQGK